MDFETGKLQYRLYSPTKGISKVSTQRIIKKLVDRAKTVIDTFTPIMKKLVKDGTLDEASPHFGPQLVDDKLFKTIKTLVFSSPVEKEEKPKNFAEKPNATNIKKVSWFDINIYQSLPTTL